MRPEPWADSAYRSGWFKSSFSNGSGTCVEVRFHDDLVSIRDSKHPRRPAHDPSNEPIITVSVEEWTAFLDELAGHAIAGPEGSLVVEDGPHGPLLRATRQRTALRFTHAEWHAYLAGVHAHEFDHPGYQDRFHDHEVAGEPHSRRHRHPELSKTV
ncbi:MAG: DUF397 domain-containing protein [Pseudonocardia sp.]